MLFDNPFGNVLQNMIHDCFVRIGGESNSDSTLHSPSRWNGTDDDARLGWQQCDKYRRKYRALVRKYERCRRKYRRDYDALARQHQKCQAKYRAKEVECETLAARLAEMCVEIERLEKALAARLKANTFKIKCTVHFKDEPSV
jgi:hypothetical protein